MLVFRLQTLTLRCFAHFLRIQGHNFDYILCCVLPNVKGRFAVFLQTENVLSCFNRSFLCALTGAGKVIARFVSDMSQFAKQLRERI